jgi:hypothetical protein
VALDPEEQAARDEALAAEAAMLPPVVTTVRIWRALLFLPYLVAAVLALVAAKLGSLLVALLVIFMAVLWAVASRRSVARYRFDDTGALYLDDEDEPVDWVSVVAIRVHHRPPWLTPKSRRDLAYHVLDVRIALRDGTEIRFARGDHFVEGGPRRPLTPGVFPRWLRARAREAGLTVEDTSDIDWIASR